MKQQPTQGKDMEDEKEEEQTTQKPTESVCQPPITKEEGEEKNGNDLDEGAR